MLSNHTQTRAEELRKQGKEYAANLKEFINELKAMPSFERGTPEAEWHGETIANATLAYRHAEDMVMRLGKVIQSNNLGVNVYDQPAPSNQ